MNQIEMIVYNLVEAGGSSFVCDKSPKSLVKIVTALLSFQLYSKWYKRGVGMVSKKSLEDQLRKIHFKGGWNHPEAAELEAILLPEEEILECVNGWYEGGFALLCATTVRVLLIDKKPLNFLTIEDLRFDTINQLNYNHRLFNAGISIAAGVKNLNFKSYDKARLRDLIAHVQHRMAEIKTMEKANKERDQKGLSDMDEQVKAYLLDQYDQQLSVRKQEEKEKAIPQLAPVVSTPKDLPDTKLETQPSGVSPDELYREAMKEMFGRPSPEPASAYEVKAESSPISRVVEANGIEVNPLRVAYSKLPMILRNRRQAMSYEAT